MLANCRKVRYDYFVHNDERTQMDTMEKQVVELESNCTCTNEDGSYTEDCFGCYDDSKENLKYLLKDWAEANNFDADKQVVRIHGRAMTWLRSEGYAVVEFDSILDAVKINGDFRLTFTLEGSALSVRRGSHDEPTGAYFTLSVMERPEE